MCNLRKNLVSWAHLKEDNSKIPALYMHFGCTVTYCVIGIHDLQRALFNCDINNVLLNINFYHVY